MANLLALKSAAEAHEAVKMAGLPAFFLGLMAVAYAAVRSLAVHQAVVDGGGYGLWQPLVIATGGATLIGLGIMLRRAHAIMALPALLIAVANFAWASMTQPVYAMIVPLLMVFLATNGLRGWLWLRRNRNLDEIF
jgi:hypothetical protein